MNKARPITQDMISGFRRAYDADETAKVFEAAVSSKPFEDVTFSLSNASKLQNHFSIDLHASKVMNQKRSGRC